jgi:hypothetical protein
VTESTLDWRIVSVIDHGWRGRPSGPQHRPDCVPRYQVHLPHHCTRAPAASTGTSGDLATALASALEDAWLGAESVAFPYPDAPQRATQATLASSPGVTLAYGARIPAHSLKEDTNDESTHS